MASIIAVDLGGTNLRAARFDTPAPPYQEVHKVPTRAEEGPEAVIERILGAIQMVLPETDQDWRIGVASPGPLNPFTGVIIDTPNLPGWEGFPLKDRLESEMGCPVSVANDANLAALGEWRHGAGRGKDHVIYLTLSTGIGSGVISGGRLLQGAGGLAPELGHMRVVPDGPLCGCGRPGHLEALAAGPAMARRARERLSHGETSERLEAAARDRALTAEDVGRAGQGGDPLAIAVISETGEYIGLHLAQLAHAFNPQVFVLGGGLARIGDLLFAPIRRALRENIMHPSFLVGLEVIPAELGDDAGLVGAMLMASEM